jgi:NADH dehydrogenase
MAADNHPRVVIIGAGFGGLWSAREFFHTPVEAWLIDQENYHTFFPLLYQVAAAELEPESIVHPIRSILHKFPNLHFLMDEVTQIDTAQQRVVTRHQNLSYDYLIISIGSKAHFYDVTGAGQYAYPLKSIEDAVRLRNHILYCFETAAMEPDPQIRQQLLTFAIVGGGPTGVEFTGALAELVKKPLARDYPTLDMNQVRILLLEATDRLLIGFPESLHRYTLKHFTHMGIDVQLNAPVNQIDQSDVILKDGRHISTQTVVWTAGVGARSLSNPWGFPTRSNGQVEVLPSLQIPEYPNIYTVGDLAHVEQDGKPLLMVATVASQEGKWASKNVLRQISGQSPVPFRYHDPGMLAVTGRNAAVARLGKLTITGFLAWVIWSTVHLYGLIGYRARLLVLINWAWDYIFFDRVVRLILPRSWNMLHRKGS